jgi:hypothetical protein
MSVTTSPLHPSEQKETNGFAILYSGFRDYHLMICSTQVRSCAQWMMTALSFSSV